jgi:penicillin amidase
MRWLRRGLGLIVVLLLAGLVAAAVYAWRVLPQTDGHLRAPGLAGEVRIERDADGIPTIRAANEHDAAYALGFVHAQDRLWQLETHKRIGSGRLAEAFGAGALDSDRFLRALQVRQAAAAQWAKTQGAARDAVLAYTEGVNAFLAQGLEARPPEFLILGVTPVPWTPEDSVAWAIMMAWDLGGNWSNELLRMRLALQLPVARVDELLPPYPGDKPPALVDYAALYKSLRVDSRLGTQAMSLIDAAPGSAGVDGVGSNNWVVAGSRSETGQPLVANDPHLGLTAPALWYFARIETPGHRVAGATMPGLPFVVLGQNEHLAWGFTNTGPDVQDVYLEKLDPANPNRYQTPGGWASFEAREEVIKVRGGADVPVTVRRTRHGPVISDAGVAEGLTGPSIKPSYVLALRWTALDDDAGALDSGVRLGAAKTVDEFVAAAQRHSAPMQSMVVADRAGRIGFVAAGRVPVRQPGNDLQGQVPAPGWDAKYDWAGWVDAGQTPREFDPARGWIATANQRIHPAGYPHHITHDWTLPYRQQRIEALLEKAPKHSIASLRAIQADIVSPATQRLLPFLAKVDSRHALAGAAQQALAGFDGTMAADRAAPLIFTAWARQLTEAVFADEVGMAIWSRSIGTKPYRDALEGVLERNDAWWCDDKRTTDSETCAQQATTAFDAALDELQLRFGTDVAAWRWGAAHQARSEHRPFSRVKALARWFELRTPIGGDTWTVNAARVSLKPDATTGELYLNGHGPSLRAVYDVAEPKNSRFVHSTGQSGIPWSPLYGSLAGRWAAVQDVPVWDAPAVKTLVLRAGEP